MYIVLAGQNDCRGWESFQYKGDDFQAMKDDCLKRFKDGIWLWFQIIHIDNLELVYNEEEAIKLRAAQAEAEMASRTYTSLWALFQGSRVNMVQYKQLQSRPWSEIHAIVLSGHGWITRLEAYIDEHCK
jgi:hypothetical protein